MKHAHLLCFILLFCTLSTLAIDYKLLFVNSSNISIGDKEIKVGDIFSDQGTIKWTQDQQAIKVVNMENGQISIITATDFKKAHSGSLYDYFFTRKHLSTRSDEVFDNKTFSMLDTLRIGTPLDPNIVDEYTALFREYGAIVHKKLMVDQDGNILLTRDLFVPNTQQITLDINANIEGEQLPIVTNLTLQFIPLQIE